MATFNMIIERGEDGYLISEVVELPGCHTQARNMNELLTRTKEAISLCLKEQSLEVENSFIGLQKIEV
jgi:predicted RNase H-like HicB family nuclease